MRKGLLAAAIVVMANAGFVFGQPESSKLPEMLPGPTAVGQQTPGRSGMGNAMLPPSGNSLDQLPQAGTVADGTMMGCPAMPCVKHDWICEDPGCFWIGVDYLHWWTKDSRLPALITTTTPGAAPLPGALGQPGTVVLFGGSELDNNERSGLCFTAGFWLNECHTCGVEGSYFFLGSRSASYDSASTGVPGSAVITRPFFDVLNGLNDAQLIAFPGIASGDVHLRYSSNFQGAELNAICNICCCPPCEQVCNTGCGWYYRLELLGGFRYLNLDENIDISESSRVNPALPHGAPFFGGSTIAIGDQFDTHNNFFGGQVGARGEVRWGRLFVGGAGKLAMGVTHEVVDIRGSTAITSPNGITTTIPSGFLASGSNSGHFSRDEFAVVPEAEINFGCVICDHLIASVGYTFLYWSSVVRPGDQIDTGLSGTQIPTDSRYNPQAGLARPAYQFRDTSFWAQGINVSMEFRY